MYTSPYAPYRSDEPPSSHSSSHPYHHPPSVAPSSPPRHTSPPTRAPTPARPPTVYVFDLDDVLMPTTALFQQPGVREWLNNAYGSQQMQRIAFAYQRVLHPNPTLIHYLHRLPGQKHVLTNASRIHAQAALSALGLEPYVQSVVDANQGFPLKPNPTPYTYLQNTIVQQLQRHVAYPPRSAAAHAALRPRMVFFDDRVENHLVPKRLGWTTVWIYGCLSERERSGYTVIPSHVDLAFATIEEALRHFLAL